MPAIIYLIYSLHSIIPRLFIYLFLLFVSFFSFCWSYMTWRYCSLDVCFRSVHHLSLDHVMASLRNSSQIYLYVYHILVCISFSFVSFQNIVFDLETVNGRRCCCGQFCCIIIHRYLSTFMSKFSDTETMSVFSWIRSLPTMSRYPNFVVSYIIINVLRSHFIQSRIPHAWVRYSNLICRFHDAAMLMLLRGIPWIIVLC